METDICIASITANIPGTYGIPMHVASGLFSSSMAVGILAFSSHHFSPTINHGPLSASHNLFYCSFLSEHSRLRMPPADRSALCPLTVLAHL